MSSSRVRREIFAEINITPLTDIFLVLLIIMMVVAPMLDYPGLKLTVPSMGPDASVTEEPKTQTVAIAADDALYGNTELTADSAIPLMTLKSILTQGKTDKPEGLVISVHPKASHGAMTRVMDIAQGAGIEKIAVTSLPDMDSELEPDQS